LQYLQNKILSQNYIYQSHNTDLFPVLRQYSWRLPILLPINLDFCCFPEESGTDGQWSVFWEDQRVLPLVVHGWPPFQLLEVHTVFFAKDFDEHTWFIGWNLHLNLNFVFRTNFLHLCLNVIFLEQSFHGLNDVPWRHGKQSHIALGDRTVIIQIIKHQ